MYADSRRGAAGVPGGGGGTPSQSPLVDVVITRAVQVCQGEVGACCCGHGSWGTKTHVGLYSVNVCEAFALLGSTFLQQVFSVFLVPQLKQFQQIIKQHLQLVQDNPATTVGIGATLAF